MALEALIFDMDGTLVDTTRLHARAWHEALQAFGYVIPEERIEQEIGKGGDRLVPALIGRSAEEKDGSDLRDRHLECYLRLIQDEQIDVFPGVEDLFEAVHERGLKVAIATAAKQETLERTVERASLTSLLDVADVVVNDSDVDESKPHPASVLPAVEKLGLSPAQCAMVGDTKYDVEACRSAGLVCLGVTTGPHDAATLQHAGARGVYRDVGDLLDHLDDALRRSSPGAASISQAQLRDLMRQALDEARAGIENGEFPIGCVLARSDGTVLARGRSLTNGSGDVLAHAEMVVLERARTHLSDGLDDLLLVTTLEPCVMCFGAAMQARIDTILYALEAPINGGVERCRPMQSPGMVVPRTIGGVGRDESRTLLADWLERHPDSPFVTELLRQLGEPVRG